MTFFKKITSRNTHNSTDGTMRLEDVVYDASVSATYPDFSYGTADNLRVRAGLGQNLATLMDLPVAIKPNYGEAEIIGYELGLYVNTLTQPPTGEQGEYQVYKNKTRVGPNEGDMEAPIDDVMFWGCTLGPEPHCDYYREDFTGGRNVDDEVYSDAAGTSTRTNPYLSVPDALTFREDTWSMSAAKTPWDLDIGMLALLVQPQVLSEVGMIRLYGDRNLTMREDYDAQETWHKGFFSFGKQHLPPNTQKIEETKIFLTTDDTGEFWVPKNKKTFSGDAYFTHPKWRKATTPAKYEHEAVTSTDSSIRGPKLDEMGTFFDKIRGVRDIKSAQQSYGGNAGETEYAMARIEFTGGLSGQACKMDQWVGWHNAGTLEEGIINNQPGLAFGLDGNEGRLAQDQYLLKKNIPKPVRLSMDDGTTASPTSGTAETNLSSFYEIEMDVKFENFEPVYRVNTPEYMGAANRGYLCRGFFIIFSSIPPGEGDTFSRYMYRISGGKVHTQHANDTPRENRANEWVISDLDVTSGVATATTTAQDSLTFKPFNGMEVYYEADDESGDNEDSGFKTVTNQSGATFSWATQDLVDTTNATGKVYLPRAWTGVGFMDHGGDSSGIICQAASAWGMGKYSNTYDVHSRTGTYPGWGTMLADTSTTGYPDPVIIPDDTWLKFSFFTDEDGTELNNSAGAADSGSQGMFKMVISDQEGNVYNDSDFYLKDISPQGTSNNCFTEGDGIDGSNNWPKHMSIWQCNFPARSTTSSDADGENTGGHTPSTGHGLDNLANHVTGEQSSAAIMYTDRALNSHDMDSANGTVSEVKYKAEAKNRRMRMTTLIDKIYFNRCGLNSYNISGKDHVTSRGEWNSTPTTEVRTPEFTTSEESKNSFTYKYPPSVLAMGFKAITDLETVGGGEESGFFLLNGFSTTDSTTNSKFTDAQMRGGYNQAAVPALMGQQARAAYYPTASATGGVTVRSAYAASVFPQISTDYTVSEHLFAAGDFTQKGTIKFTEGSGNIMSAGDYALTKRENIYVSSRIVKVWDSVNGIFEVDNTRIFEADADERFIIFLEGKTFQTADRLDADGDKGNNTWIAPVKIKKIDEKKITIEGWVEDAETTKVATFANLLKQDNISQLFISPYRYWVNMTFINEGEYPRRTYKSILPVNNFTDPGVTFSESDFYSDLDTGVVTQHYYNARSLVTVDGGASTIEVTKDYGYGSLDTETGEGGHCGKIVPDSIGWNVIPLPLLQREEEFKEDDVVSLFVTTQSKADTHEMAFYSSNYTTDTNKRPFLVTVFADERPEISSFSMVPDEDSNGYYSKFEWSVDAEDTWYGFLNIDKGDVVNQYHNSIIWAPLNDLGTVERFGTNHGVAASKPAIYTNGGVTPYNPSNVVISGPLYDYEGLTGNCLRFDGSDDYIEINNGAGSDPTGDCTTEMTIILHIIPESASDQRVILSQFEDTVEKFFISMNSSNQIEARVNYDTGANYVTLTSPSIVADGETPTVIILTVDTTLKTGNIKLFINGKLADMSGKSNSSGGANNWKSGQNINGGNSELYIGNSSNTGTQGFEGRLEEVVIYKTALYPVDVKTQTYTLVKDFSELIDSQTSSSPQTRQAKLFVKDYHNIRGRTTSDVASSQAVILHKAGFHLDTTA